VLRSLSAAADSDIEIFKDDLIVYRIGRRAPMMSRRGFIATGAVAGVAIAGGLAFRSFRDAAHAYEDAAQRTWRPIASGLAKPNARMRELVRYAALAPSSHNTQCWRFKLGERSVSIRPDLQRRCPAVDPDDHHLFVSLGCAAACNRFSAAVMGLHGDPVFDSEADGALDVALVPTKALPSPLFDAIVHRQSTRTEFDAKPLSNADLRLLEAAGTGNGVRVELITESTAMASVLDFVVQGNTAQMRDPAFVRELKQWMRFNGAQAATSGDGLFSACSGNPTGPEWLGSLMFDMFFKEKAENDKYARQIRSSAGIAVFVSQADDRAHWVEAGRAFERFALQATALGIRNAHLNQPVEVASLRSKFARSIGVTSGRPDLVVRFGRGPEMPRSLRRPIETMLV
jgi:hypothetical protein